MNHFLRLSAGTLAAIALTACVDDKYDLSDIDTTVQVEVNDLTLPVNIDPFTMSSIFDIDENDPDATVKVVDGIYAIVRSGEFSSSQIRIAPITLNSHVSTSVSATINTNVSGNVPGGIDLSIPLAIDEVSVSYASDNIPVEIVSIDRIGGDFRVDFILSFPELDGRLRRLSLRDLDIDFPKGLTGTISAGTYDPENGRVHIDRIDLTSPRLTLSLVCSALDFKKIGGTFSASSHSASIATKLEVKSGRLCFNTSDFTGNVPSAITFSATGQLSDINVRTFSGTINYDIDGVNISPVTLSDLPDVLRQKDTRINIINPQIYLNVSNPLSPYGLQAQTGFNILSVFRDDNGTVTGKTEHALDAPGYFTISKAANSNYCLSPLGPTNVPSGFNPATQVDFSSLSSVLEGNGLPSELDITLVSPKVANQKVSNLPIGSDLGIVSGRYEFVAPLSFGEGSQVIYTDTESGWNDEDVDAITIRSLSVSTTVSSQLPIDVNFTGYPIDVNGRRINNVSIEGAVVPAGCKDYPITIRITGEVKHLDGIEFTATGVVPSNMTGPLSPRLSLDCKDIRATVSGYYNKEL